MAQKNDRVRIESAEHFGSDMLIIELTDETVLQLTVQQIAALAAENKRPRRGLFRQLSKRIKASSSQTPRPITRNNPGCGPRARVSFPPWSHLPPGSESVATPSPGMRRSSGDELYIHFDSLRP